MADTLRAAVARLAATLDERVSYADRALARDGANAPQTIRMARNINRQIADELNRALALPDFALDVEGASA